MDKNSTWLWVILGIAGAFLLYMFSKKNTAAPSLGVVGASTVSPLGSSSGILTPVEATSAVDAGISAVETLFSGENSDSSYDNSVGEGDLSELNVTDDLAYQD